MLPSLKDPAFIGALLHFDRAAHHLSFAAAARELGVTPSAVSHRIADLESALGKRLFERETRRVRLTGDGVELARMTHDALALLRQATETLAARQVLRVSVGPFLSAAWLMPRLADFERRHAGVRVDLLHRFGMHDLRDVDVAIVWWDDLPSRVVGHRLFDTVCIPVVAPRVAWKGAFWESSLPPIHYRDRILWREWLTAAGGPKNYAERGEVFDDPNLTTEAAAHGRGVAMGYLPFVAEQIDAGRLIRAHAFVFRQPKQYWLIVPDNSNRLARAFRDWTTAEAAKLGPKPRGKRSRAVVEDRS
jgi:LysR family glycine cleavage system transcriptional activator